MFQLRKLSIIVVVIAAAMLLQSTDAAEYIVGGKTGWTHSPPGGDRWYSDWAKRYIFHINDTLVFNFETGKENVAILSSKHDFNKCKVNEKIPAMETGPARVTLNSTGVYYFACTLEGHCKSGQKLKVYVNYLPPSSTQAPASGPEDHHHHHHKGSATTLTAAIFPLLLFTLAFSVFFH